MSIRGIRKSDYVRGMRHVRAHLLRAGTERSTLCGDPPLTTARLMSMFRVCTSERDLEELLRRGQLADVRLVPCSLCLREVEVHIRAPWIAGELATREGPTGQTVSVCGRGLWVSERAMQDTADSVWNAMGVVGVIGVVYGAVNGALTPDRSIAAAEAVAWAESESPELWRLCRVCEVGLAAHLQAESTFTDRAMARAGARQAREGGRALADMSRQAKNARRRELAAAAGVEIRPHRRKAAPAGAAAVDPRSAALAEEDS